MRADERLAVLVRVLGLQIGHTAPLVYPRVYTMEPLSERAGRSTEVGENVYLPPTIACSSEKLAADRIYLLDNGVVLRLYIREQVPAEVLWRVFGVETAAEVSAALVRMANPDAQRSDEATRILGIVQQIRSERSRLPWLPFQVVVAGTADESRLQASICEDRMAGESNYVDFLCHCHKMVQNKQE